MRQPGIEPGPLAWKASILTTGLLALRDNDGTRTRNPQLRRLVRYPLRHIVNVLRTGIEPRSNQLS